MIDIGNTNVAEYFAALLMLLIFNLNIFTLISFIDVFLDIKINYDTKLNILLLCLFEIVVFYFMFIKEKKYLEIAKFYENETKKNKVIGNLFILSYIILSFILILFSFFLMIKKNRGQL